ncbi:MAG TPA: hypothetical protein VGH72_33710 [Pseudonocardia sp.]
MDTNLRGFVRATPQINRLQESVQVYESSNADGPHVWIKGAEQDGTATTVELPAEQAYRFAESIMNLCRVHYQGDARPADRVTVFTTDDIPGRP